LEGLGKLNHSFSCHFFVLKRKLPGTPLLLVVPSGPTTSISSGTSSKRARFWHNHLSVLGKVVPVTMHTSNGGSGVSISQCLDHIIGAVRIKVLEVKKICITNWLHSEIFLQAIFLAIFLAMTNACVPGVVATGLSL